MFAGELTRSELTRYDRQMLIPGWGIDGQKKLKKAKVVIIGAGGLGSPASIYLAAAGVGKLVIVDKEKFELSNLNRQILGWNKDVGRYKAKAAVEKLKELNPDIEVIAKISEITRENIRDLIKGANAVVDALDNWRTRFVVNDGCVKERIPLVHAGIYGFSGQITTIMPGRGPCLRCILPKIPKEIPRFPVVGATSALFASLQVMEVLKLIIGIGKPLIGKILIFDGLEMSFSIVNAQRRSDCPVCSELFT